MRVVAEPFEKLAEVLVHVGVERDLVHEPIVLFLVRQLPVAQQPRYFEERRVLGELLDGIAAEAENSLVAIDVGDRTPARRRVQERGIVAHQTRIVGTLGLDLLELGGANGGLGDWNRIALAGAIVLYFERAPRGSSGGGRR